jgi:hypothetical protein
VVSICQLFRRYSLLYSLDLYGCTMLIRAADQ